MQYLDAISKNNRMISVRFQGKPFNITVIQVYAPTSNAEEAEVEWFCEDLQDLLELTPTKRNNYLNVKSNLPNYFVFLQKDLEYNSQPCPASVFHGSKSIQVCTPPSQSEAGFTGTSPTTFRP